MSDHRRAAAKPKPRRRARSSVIGHFATDALMAHVLVGRVEQELARAVSLLTATGEFLDSMTKSKARLEACVDELEKRAQKFRYLH
ncbi:MAG: hypothetical protein M3T56_10300 [Chloroflexota bacterium]|nr:hypothetical protein [Chloroflexota bacterium]